MLPIDRTVDGIRGPFVQKGDLGFRLNSFKYSGLWQEADTPRRSFQFVQAVIRAPVVFPRALFLEKLIHINQDYAPLQWDDIEICLRAWDLGLAVGWYPAGFKHGHLCASGIREWNQQLLQYQDELNAKRIYETYGAKLEQIQQQVDQANGATIALKSDRWSTYD